MNCKNNSSCCSPYSILAQQLEETNTRAVQAYNIAVQCLRNPLAEDLTINADLIVNGDIFQYGAAYETHAEKVYTNDDYIVMREGAVSALAAGDYSGFQVTKYDGTNDGRLVIDKDGTARVGDVNDEQPLATRDEAADLTDGHLLKWDAANLKLKDAGAGMVTSWTNPPSDANIPSEKLVKDALDGKVDSFEGRTGYEHSDLVYAMYDGQDTPMNWSNTQASNLNFAVYHANGGLYVGTPTYDQEATTKKYVDDAIAGISPSVTWTQRTANNDWTDLFDIEANNSITAKKTILLKLDGVTILDAIIPKGYNKSTINLIGYRAYPVYPPNTSLTLFKQLSIKASNVVSSASNIDNQSYNMTATVNGTNVEFTLLTSSGSDAKSNFKIFTLD